MSTPVYIIIFADQVFIDPTFFNIFVCGPLQSLVVNVCTLKNYFLSCSTARGHISTIKKLALFQGTDWIFPPPINEQNVEKFVSALIMPRRFVGLLPNRTTSVSDSPGAFRSLKTTALKLNYEPIGN